MKQVNLYLSRQASSIGRYVWEQIVQAAVGWIPGIVGIGARAIVYRAILHMEGAAAIEDGVRIRFADNVRLSRGVYLDHGVYLHACPGGISIGPDSYVMKNAILHVYNFRDLPHAGIRIGARSLIGEACILRGQGGITIGDDVFLAPLVQMLAVNHVYHDTSSQSASRNHLPGDHRRGRSVDRRRRDHPRWRAHRQKCGRRRGGGRDPRCSRLLRRRWQPGAHRPRPAQPASGAGEGSGVLNRVP